ncbi:MAG TPA: DNA polymerase III subunit delta' [bacterium]|nr:DNA polymerase III subunit delta' [bacterium]
MFDWQIIGHKKITHFLEQTIVNHKLAHGYLFYGQKQLGKKTLVKKFIQTLLCYENDPKKENLPCGTCPACQQILKNNYPDIIWLKKETEKKEITIEQIRSLQSTLSTHSFFKSYKIALIENVENLNNNAANAFLKTLEEPHKKTIIILTANNLHSIPPTILSRVQKIKLLPVPAKEIYNFLLSQGKTHEEARILAKISEGKPGRTLTFLRAPDLWQGYLNQIKIFFYLVVGSYHQRLVFTEKILNKTDNSSDKLKTISPMLNIWQLLFRDLVLLKLNQNDKIINIIELEKLAKISQKYTPRELLNIIKNIQKLKKDLLTNVNIKLALENLLLQF